MGHVPARLLRLLAYAIMACGASFGCLLLLSAPAQADDSGSPLSLLEDASSEADGAVGSAGRVVGEIGRTAASRTTDVVGEVVAVAPAAKPIADTASRTVEQTADVVSTQVEKVASDVDVRVVPVPLDPPAVEPPVQEPRAELPSGGTATGEPARDERARDAARDHDRDRPADRERRSGDRERSAPHDASLDRILVPSIQTVDAQPGDTTATATSAASHGAGGTEDVAPWADPGSCAECALASSGSSADGPTIHGLVGSGPPVAEGLTGARTDRAGLRPALTFSCPDVSPG